MRRDISVHTPESRVDTAAVDELLVGSWWLGYRAVLENNDLVWEGFSAVIPEKVKMGLLAAVEDGTQTVCDEYTSPLFFFEDRRYVAHEGFLSVGVQCGSLAIQVPPSVSTSQGGGETRREWGESDGFVKEQQRRILQ